MITWNAMPGPRSSVKSWSIWSTTNRAATMPAAMSRARVLPMAGSAESRRTKKSADISRDASLPPSGNPR